MKKVLIVAGLILFFVVTKVSAHQLRIVSGNFTEIKSPTIAQAFYGELNGQPEIFEITSDKPFNLYVGILASNLKIISKDVSARIFKDNQEFYFLEASSSEWNVFYEEYNEDKYFWGPEYKADDSTVEKLQGRQVEAGIYKIEVFSHDNLGKYILAVGEKEIYNANGIRNTTTALPQSNTGIFNESVLSTFSGKSIIYLFVPAAVLFMFFISGICITVILGRQRLKEGLNNLDKKK